MEVNLTSLFFFLAHLFTIEELILQVCSVCHTWLHVSIILRDTVFSEVIVQTEYWDMSSVTIDTFPNDKIVAIIASARDEKWWQQQQ